MKKIILLLILTQLCLNAGIPVTQDYHGPTEQLIKRETWKKIEKKLIDIKIPRSLFPFFNEIAKQEDWGHIGYHGATQDYRIYQDVIRLTMEEIVSIPIREDFQFLRVPGDKDLNLNSMDEFRDYWGKKIDNYNEKRAKQLLSMNYGIYSNFDHKGSSSIALFVKDKSKSDINYAKKLYGFYSELGIPVQALTELFKLARTHLDSNRGILLRISENSHWTDLRGEAYNFTDRQTYPCKKGGYPWGRHLISGEFERLMSKPYILHQIDIAPQLRLLLNNRYTLNPYSHLCVERCDLYDLDAITAYEEEMREFIRGLVSDKVKVEAYRAKLLNLWSEE